MLSAKCILYQHYKKWPKTIDHLNTPCNKMVFYNYIRWHGEVMRWIRLGLCIKYGLKAFPCMKNNLVQEIVFDENVKISVNTWIIIKIKINVSWFSILIHNKKNHEIIFIEFVITSPGWLFTVETEKPHRYGILANKLEFESKRKTN